MPDETIYLWPERCPGDRVDAEAWPRLDVYFPQGADRHDQGVIILPGGGYEMLAPHEGEPFARLFANAGYLAIVCHYRVAPHRYPAPMADAARAVRLARQCGREWGIRSDGWALMGFSAGGHLASTSATQPDLVRDDNDDLVGIRSARPDRLILAYPVVSLVREYHRGSAIALLGPRPPEVLRRQLSNELHVTARNPPTFIFHTQDDQVVPVSNSRRYAAACREHGVPVALHVYPSGPHGIGLADGWPDLRDWTLRLLQWLALAPCRAETRLTTPAPAR